MTSEVIQDHFYAKIILFRLWTDFNENLYIMKTQFFHKIMYDLKCIIFLR